MLCRQGSVRLQEQEVVEKATQTGSFLTTDQDIPAMGAKLVYRLVEALDESTRDKLFLDISEADIPVSGPLQSSGEITVGVYSIRR
jgi:hypothetical protein